MYRSLAGFRCFSCVLYADCSWHAQQIANVSDFLTFADVNKKLTACIVFHHNWPWNSGGKRMQPCSVCGGNVRGNPFPGDTLEFRRKASHTVRVAHMRKVLNYVEEYTSRTRTNVSIIPSWLLARKRLAFIPKSMPTKSCNTWHTMGVISSVL